KTEVETVPAAKRHKKHKTKVETVHLFCVSFVLFCGLVSLVIFCGPASISVLRFPKNHAEACGEAIVAAGIGVLPCHLAHFAYHLPRARLLRSWRPLAHQGRRDHPRSRLPPLRYVYVHVRREDLDSAAVGGRSADGGRPSHRRPRYPVARLHGSDRRAIYADLSAGGACRNGAV